MAPVTKGMGGVTLVLFMFVCGAFSFGLTYQASLRLDKDGQSTCDSGAEKGVCYDPLNCLRVSGMFGNNCPGSTGVCCLFYRQCNQQSSQEVSYFRNTDEEAGSGCSYRVVKRSSLYCGMRVNLEQLDLPGNCQTSLSIEGIYQKENKGKLLFPETRDSNNTSDKICSTKAGIEYLIDTKPVDEVRVNVQSSGKMTGKWKIRVTQVKCKDDKPSVHASHIPAIWPPPIPTHSWQNTGKPTTPTPWTKTTTTTTTTRRPSAATCWWNCPVTGTTQGITQTQSTEATPIIPGEFATCGIRGPSKKRSDLQNILNFRTVQRESKPFVEDTVWGNAFTEAQNGSIFAEEIKRRELEIGGVIFDLKITYGKPAGKREYPWQVGMKVRGRFHCGASIIGDQWILTAAHCVTKYKRSPRSLYLTLGDWDLSTSTDQNNLVPTVERVTVHPQYSRTTLRNDLAVLKLTKKIEWAENIRPICLPPAGLDTTGKTAFVTGWGRDENNRLQSVLHELASEVTTNSYCARQWEKNGAPGGFITKDMMCMSPIGGDSCNGDSGGPSITNIGGIEYQIGIVSFGSGSCVDPDLPGVYTRVTSYVDWIRAQMN